MSAGEIEPSAEIASIKASLDVSRVFITYLSCGGDRFKTSAVSGVSVDTITLLERHERWDLKLKSRHELAQAENKSVDEFDRELRRLQLLSQATRLKDEIDEVLLHLANLPREEKLKYLFEVSKNGSKKPTGAFYVELAKAVETCNNCIYRASGDQLPARPESPDPSKTAIAHSLSLSGALSQLLGGAGAETKTE